MTPIRWSIQSAVFSAAMCTGAVQSMPLGDISNIACAPTQKDVAVAVSENTIWQTFDGGRSWRFAAAVLDDSAEADSPDLIEGADELGDEGSIPASDEAEVANPDGALDGMSVSDGGQDDSESAYRSASPSTAIVAAVDDSGSIAWSCGENVSVFDNHRRVRRSLSVSNVRDALFDNRGRLFVIGDDKLFYFGNASEGYRTKTILSVARPVALIRGQDGSVALLAQNGLFHALDRRGKLSFVRIVSLGRGLGAAWGGHGAESERGWYIIDRLNLIYVQEGDKTDTDIRVPLETRKIIVDAASKIRIFVPGVGWRSFENGFFRGLPFTAAAVDAAGRFWQSGPSGFVSPVSVFSMPAVFDKNLSDDQFVSANETAMDFPVPPRCRAFSIRPAPDVSLRFVWRSNKTIQFDGMTSEHPFGRFAFSLALSWQIGSHGFTDCVEKRRHFSDDRLRIRRRADDVRALLLRAAERVKGASSLVEAIDARMARDASAALLNLFSARVVEAK